MALVKLPFKIAALPVILVLYIIQWLGPLASSLSSIVTNLLGTAAVLVSIAIRMFSLGTEQDSLHMLFTGLGRFIVPYLLGLILVPLAGVRETLKDFITAWHFSKHPYCGVTGSHTPMTPFLCQKEAISMNVLVVEPGKVPYESDIAPGLASLQKAVDGYVWGGYTPDTSFDCSGFISWIFTETGVVNIGHRGANGLWSMCRRGSAEEAKPGDIVFFEGTIPGEDGITHCGLYVGNGMMIHCGSPIGYADITSGYFKQHFYAFGRIYEH